jgi:hypothetical protein
VNLAPNVLTRKINVQPSDLYLVFHTNDFIVDV